MQMSNLEIVGRYRRADNKKEQIEILAQLNGCNKEQIKGILIEGGIAESQLPKSRGPRPKKQLERQTGEAQTDGEISVEITGGEGDVEGYDVFDEHRPVEEILATEIRNDKEADRVARYQLIPEPVRELCRNEIKRLNAEIMKLEKQYDSIVDYMNGETV